MAANCARAKLATYLNTKIHELCRRRGWNPHQLTRAIFLHSLENEPLLEPMLQRLGVLKKEIMESSGA